MPKVDHTIALSYLKIFLIVWLGLMALALNAQDARWNSWQQQADSLAEKEEYQKAIKLYTKIIESANTESEEIFQILYKRAVSYYSAGEFQLAVHDINRFIKAYPSVAQAYMLKAFIYRELDDVDKQLQCLDTLVELQPFNTELLKWQASLMIEKDEYLPARDKLKRARTFKNDAEVELYMGLTYFYMEDADSALLHFDQAIALDQSYLTAYLYAGLLCVNESAYHLALQYLDNAKAIDDSNLAVQFYRGIALVELNQKEEGCRCLSKAFYGGLDDAGGYLEEYCFSPSLD